MKRRLPRQGGFAYVAAILLLVVVAGLATAIVRLNAVQQNTANDALLVTRASQAARAGTEWMIYRIARTANSCQEVTLDLRAASGFLVTVTCTPAGAFVEGWDPDAPGVFTTQRMYTVESVACNGSALRCPDDSSVGGADYTERRRVATICLRDNPPPGTLVEAPAEDALRHC